MIQHPPRTGKAPHELPILGLKPPEASTNNNGWTILRLWWIVKELPLLMCGLIS